MKQRYNYLDIRTAVNELHPKIESTYIQNIYSSGQRTFYLRTNKNIFLIEAGLRIHLTNTYPSDEISFFAKRLRTYLRRKKVGGVRQVGFDRAVVVQIGEFLVVIEMFSAGNLIVLEKESVADENECEEENGARNKLSAEDLNAFEMSKQGDAVVNIEKRTDVDKKTNKKLSNRTGEELPKKESKVKKKLRESIVKGLKVHKNGDRERIDLNDIYNLKNKYKIVDIFRPVAELNMIKGSYYVFNPIQLNFKYSFFQNVDTFIGLDKEINEFIENLLKVRIGMARRGRKLNNISKNCITDPLVSDKTAKHLSSDEKTLQTTAFKEYMKQIDLKSLDDHDIVVFDAFFDNLKKVFEENKDYGAIIEKKGKATNYICLDFHKIDLTGEFLACYPLNLRTFGSFNDCVNSFYASSKKVQKKVNLSKREKVREQQLKYIQEIDNEENELRKSAIIIGMARDDINKIFKVLNYVKNNKISWELFFKQKAEEKDPLNRDSILKVDFIKNEVLVRIFYDRGVFDENDEHGPVGTEQKNDNEYDNKNSKKIAIDHSKNSFEKDKPTKEGVGVSKRCYKDILLFYKLSIDKNMNYYYNQMKNKKIKREKIRNNLESILANIVEKKAVVKPQEIKKRVLFWFEKFNFTITSNGFLVLGGKNASQNEVLNKRKFLLFFHADIKGGSAVTIDGTRINILGRCAKHESSSETSIKRIVASSDNAYGLKEEDITDASQMCMVYSNCWKDRIVSDSYYVNEDQVSKSAPSGEFLSKGGFMVKGKKNYVHNVRLEYAIALLFALEKNLEQQIENMHVGGDKNHEQKNISGDVNKQNLINDNTADLNGENSVKTSTVTANQDMQMVFTASPAETDGISFAFPIAGSWDTLKTYKFAIKIVPSRKC
ncbi:putative RNA-binding protein [Trachipleistophora hominis]|uniref:Putative RNA-binding protein n=1 Tax=Trachipleistophora hominis TaxID=72359 RepID=L7JUF9_TRAHO|nr:putative RNA-binding protein [Trachipleistophora hominis]